MLHDPAICTAGLSAMQYASRSKDKDKRLDYHVSLMTGPTGGTGSQHGKSWQNLEDGIFSIAKHGIVSKKHIYRRTIETSQK